ncbi:MAG: TRAP transporter small permease [Desulfobulbaceae bacterium]|nr:MAG: TRAP transporter small permease [Desulfobulbaceae bacterium]
MKALEKVALILGKINGLVEKLAVTLAWMMLFAITMLNIVQVFYRYVLNNALSWSEEASLWMMVWITFIILPVAYHKGLNISMMFFRDMLGRNRIEFVIRCVFHIVVLVIAVVCLDLAWDMYKGGSRIELPALEVSKAWVYMIMPPAWALLIIAAVEGLVKDFIGVLDPEAAREVEDLRDGNVSEEAAA